MKKMTTNETLVVDEVPGNMSSVVRWNITEEEVKLICGTPTESTDVSFRLTQFWSSGVVVCVFGAFGLVGNVLTGLTLRTMSRTITLFNKLLLTLAIIDSLFIMSGGAFMTKQAFKYKSELYTALFPILTYPVAGLSMTGSTYMCVAISVERYLGICHRTIKLHRKFRFYLVGIVFLTFAIESPRFFEIEGYQRNGTYSYKYAKHRWSASYVTYYSMWFRLFATALVPLVALIYFNAKIFVYYRENNFTRAHTVMRRMTQGCVPTDASAGGATATTTEGDGAPGSTGNEAESAAVKQNGTEEQDKICRRHSRKAHRERTLFIMLCCITFTFFFCHLPRICLNVYEFVRQEYVIICVHDFGTSWNLPRWGRFVNEVSNALLILNSSANFVYYCLVGQAFRQHLLEMLKRNTQFVYRLFKKRRDDDRSPSFEHNVNLETRVRSIEENIRDMEDEEEYEDDNHSFGGATRAPSFELKPLQRQRSSNVSNGTTKKTTSFKLANV